MPSERYEIYVTDRGVSQNAPPVASSQNAESGTPPQTKSTGTATGAMNRYISSTLIKPVISSMVDLVTSQVETATGSKRLQQQADMVKSIVGTTTGAVQAALGGAAVAGFAGGVAGLAIYGILQGVNVVSQRVSLSLEHKNEAEELAIARNRAGIQYSGGR